MRFWDWVVLKNTLPGRLEQRCRHRESVNWRSSLVFVRPLFCFGISCYLRTAFVRDTSKLLYRVRCTGRVPLTIGSSPTLTLADICIWLTGARWASIIGTPVALTPTRRAAASAHQRAGRARTRYSGEWINRGQETYSIMALTPPTGLAL